MKDRQTSSAQPSEPTTTAGIAKEQHQQILDLKRAGYGTRRIAERTGLNRKTVQDVLRKAGHLNGKVVMAPGTKRTSKLNAFSTSIEEKAKAGLTTTRILRELRQEGYTGGRTILAERVLKVRGSGSQKKLRKRFETGPGDEMQVDWSPYRVQLGDTMRTVHAFCAVLHHSRKAHVRFYLDERQSTLLEAHTHAFEDFGGVTRRIVYDRMATVVLGQIKGNEPIWHPRFKDFAQHYGFAPSLCRASYPDRKGAVERFYLYLERDFVQAATFASLEEMNERVRIWLLEVANRRVHRTTGLVPHEAWIAEREFLIRLPTAAFATCDEELRYVDEDATLTIRGTPYTVPKELANGNVYVRLFAERFEVLAKRGEVAFARPYVGERDKGKLQIDQRHYEGMPQADHPASGPAHRLEEAFLVRFPTLADLVVGLKLRMKRLAHIHLRILWRLCERYGEAAFVPAATRAQEHRAFSAHVVRRILEQSGASPHDEAIAPISASGRAAALLGNIDSGSLDDYAHLDETGQEEADHE